MRRLVGLLRRARASGGSSIRRRRLTTAPDLKDTASHYPSQNSFCQLANPQALTHYSRGGTAVGDFMFRTESFRLAAALAAALSLSLLPRAAHAFTAEQQQYCTGDALRLCGSEIPNVDRITACMIRNKSQLSPACLRVFGPAPAASAPAVENVRPASMHKFRSHRPKRPQSADAS